MNWIIVTGIPGSGKTTLSGILSRDLKLKIISMDDYKYRFFQTGYATKEEKSQLAKEAEKCFLSSLIATGKSNEDVIIDKWFTGFNFINKARAELHPNIICIRLLVEPKVALERFNQRIIKEEKHPTSFPDSKYVPGSGLNEKGKPLSFEEYSKKIASDFDKAFPNHLLEINENGKFSNGQIHDIEDFVRKCENDF